LKVRFEDEAALLQALQEAQEEREALLIPIRHELEAVDILTTNHKQEQARLLDLYLSNPKLPKELFNTKNDAIEKTLADLHTRRVKLQAEFDRQALTTAQVQSIMELRPAVLQGILEAENDFTERRRLVEMLDVRCELEKKDGVKWVHVKCMVGESVIGYEQSNWYNCSKLISAFLIAHIPLL
jgi:hypothetical protein